MVSRSSTAADLAANLDQLNPYMARVLKLLIPFIQRTGIDVGMTFPMQPGADEIAMRDPDVPLRSAPGEPGDSLAWCGSMSITMMKASLRFCRSHPRTLNNALGYSLRQAQLDPEFVDKMEDAGIQHITMRTTPEGWFCIRMIPNCPIWPGQTKTCRIPPCLVDDMVALYDQPEWDAVSEAVNLMLPLLDNVDGEFVLLFPVPAGTESIPIPQP